MIKHANNIFGVAQLLSQIEMHFLRDTFVYLKIKEIFYTSKWNFS